MSHDDLLDGGAVTLHESRETRLKYFCCYTVVDPDKQIISKTVFVAGGTGGLGRAVTLAFAEQDANVRGHLSECLQEFAALKPSSRIEGVQLDVTDDKAVAAAVDQIVAKARIGWTSLMNAVGGYVSAESNSGKPDFTMRWTACWP